MTVRAAIDTNILLYAISIEPSELPKRNIAEMLIQQPDWGVSTQVLQEFYVNATKGKVPTMSRAEAQHAVEQFLDRDVIGMTPALLRQAMSLHQRYQVSYWDAAVIASAKALGAATLYSEDLNPGQIYDGVRVENPFV